MSTERRGDIVRRCPNGTSREAVDALGRYGEGAVVKEENAELISALPSDRMPDASHVVRRDLQAEGVVFSVMGSAVETVTRRDASAPVRSEVRAEPASCAAAGVGKIRLAEAGSP